MVRVTYIWHDCFVVELPSVLLVFDYWRDERGENNASPAFLDSLDAGKPLYVFISHGHKDHFNPAVFGWYSRFGSVSYVVSRDVFHRIRHVISDSSVYAGPKVPTDSVTVLSAASPWTSPGHGVRCKAVPSTDIGNAYIVECDGVRIFHAGDLNAWTWRDEDDEAQVRKALGDYLACLQKIDDAMREAGCDGPAEFDYCFFPVDSRIGTGYACGAAEFVRRFRVRRFFPMHFALGDADEREVRRRDALRFDLYANPEYGEYLPLCFPGISMSAAL